MPCTETSANTRGVFRANRLTRSLSAAGLAGLLLFSTACGTAEPPEVQSPTVATTQGSEEPTPAPTESAKETVSTKEVLSALAKDKVQPTGALLGNKNGEYPQLKLAKGNPLTKAPEGPLPSGWSASDANAATDIAMTFVLQDIVDSPANGDFSKKQEWIDQNAALFHSWGREVIVDYIQAQKHGENVFIDGSSWYEDKGYSYHKGEPSYESVNYGYIHDGKTPRLSSFDVDITGSSIEEQNAYHLDFAGSYTMVATSDLGVHDEVTSIEGYIEVMKDEDGVLRISRISTDSETIPPSLKG